MYDNSVLTIKTPGTTQENGYRASIGFHNTGWNGCAIYLDMDGALKVIWNDGAVKVLASK